MPIITSEKLEIYQNCLYYLEEPGNTANLKITEQLLSHEDRFYIQSVLQDIELIKKRLTSDDFAAKILVGLKQNSDENTFIKLATRIPFYKEFQKVAEIVSIVKDTFSADTDFVWSHFENFEIAEEILQNDIENLKLCSFVSLSDTYLNFAPTGTFQELSMSNGWTDDYMVLAEKFDRLYSDIHKKTPGTSTVTSLKQLNVWQRIGRFFKQL